MSSITIDLGAGDDALELEETLTDLLRFNGVVIGLEGGVGDDSLTGPIADSSWSVTSENTGALAIGATPIVNFTNTENLVGRGIDTLAGPDQATTWNVTGEDSGNLQNGSSTLINFSGIPHLSGGSGDDTFNIIDSGVVGDGGQLSGPLDGGGGTDTIDYSGYDHEILISVALSVGTALESFTNVESFVGGNHNYTTPGLTESATSAVRIGERVQVGDRIYTYIGENDLTPLSLAPLTIENSPNGVLYEDTNFWAISTGNTILGDAGENSWSITGADAGSINGVASFSNFQIATGSTGLDTFTFADGGSLSGGVDGGGVVNSTSQQIVCRRRFRSAKRYCWMTH